MRYHTFSRMPILFDHDRNADKYVDKCSNLWITSDQSHQTNSTRSCSSSRCVKCISSSVSGEITSISLGSQRSSMRCRSCGRASSLPVHPSQSSVFLLTVLSILFGNEK